MGQLWPGQLWPTLLAEAWSALSGESGGAGEVRLPAGLEVLRVSGAPGNLPSRLPAEDVAIACTGAALLAAAALHAQRGGDSGSRGSPVVRLDREHVAAAFRSEALLRVDGEPAGPGFAPLSRFWRAADGWVRTHGNYPWHRAALLRALGCAGDPEPVAAAITELGARQAEDLVTGAGGVAAAVRDEASWQAEPPGQAVAATPLVEATSVGGAPPRWRPAGALPCQLLDHGTGYLCAAAALQALARQSARGGTQFRELSLARTAHWLLGQPRETLPRETAETPPPGDDEQRWLTRVDSAAGPVTTVLPPGRLDDEPLTWPQPLSRYGADEAAWPR